MNTLLGKAPSRVADFVQTDVLICSPQTPVSEAAALMRRRACGSVVVMEGEKPVGIWTEHDAVRVDFTDPAAFEQPVSAVMSAPLKSIPVTISAAEAGVIFQQARIRHLLVVDGTGTMVGVLSQTDLALRYGVEHFLRLRMVGESLGARVLCLPDSLSIGEVARRMAEARLDAVVIDMADGERGIVTERDLVGLVARKQGRGSIGAVAVRPLRTIEAGRPLLEARRLLVESGFRHLGVVDGTDRLLGLLTMGDVLEALQRDYMSDLEADLQHSRQDLSLARQVIDSSSSAVMVVDGDGTIQSINPAFTRLTGFTAEQALGRNPDTLISCDRATPDFFTSLVARTNQEGEWSGVMWCRRHDGTLRAWAMLVHAVTDEKGPTGRFAVVFHDATDSAKAETALKEERDLIAAGPSVVFKWAPTEGWPVTYVSPNVKRILGYAPQDLMAGRPAYASLIHPGDLERVAAEIAAHMSGGADLHLEQHYRLRHADGAWRWVDDYTTIVRDPDSGAVLSINGYVVDVTTRKTLELELQERDARFRQFAKAIDLAFWIRTPDEMLYISPAYETIWGRSREDLYAQPNSFAEALHPEDQERVLPLMIQALNGGGRFNETFRIQRPDGEVRWIHAVSYPVEEGEPSQRSVGTAADVTATHEARVLMEQQREALERSNAELEQFAYVASHDLRQPLRMVNSYTQLLERSLKDSLDDRTREFMAFIRDGAERMDQMLVSLLEYSRVGRIGEPQAPIDSRQLLDEALQYLSPQIAESGADVQIKGDWPVVLASRNEGVRLFQNLIGNALKYRSPTLAPVVEVAVVRDGKVWAFSIRDNGIGIDPAQFGRLFKVFQRLHGRSQYEGTGIGLALCRKIVERHGGTIRVESEGEGKGSTFTFTLPYL